MVSLSLNLSVGYWYELLLEYPSVGAWMSRLGSLGPRQFYLMDVGDEVGSGYVVGEGVCLAALPNRHAGQFRRCVLESARARHFCGVSEDVSED